MEGLQYRKHVEASRNPKPDPQGERLFDVTDAAPHVDQYAPGLLNEDQWSARSDVWHHGSKNPVWDRHNDIDPLMHVGTRAASEELGRPHTYRFRVPKEQVAGELLGDFTANAMHASYNRKRGYPVSPSVQDSIDGGAHVVDDRRDRALSQGMAYPYKNAVEDKGSTSLVVPQKTARLWSEDVIEQRNKSWESPHAHEEPSPSLQDKAEYIGPSGEGRAEHTGEAPFPYKGPQPTLRSEGFNPMSWERAYRNKSVALMGSRPLAEKTRGGAAIPTPRYSGTAIRAEQEEASARLSETMRRLLG